MSVSVLPWLREHQRVLCAAMGQALHLSDEDVQEQVRGLVERGELCCDFIVRGQDSESGSERMKLCTSQKECECALRTFASDAKAEVYSTWTASQDTAACTDSHTPAAVDRCGVRRVAVPFHDRVYPLSTREQTIEMKRSKSSASDIAKSFAALTTESKCDVTTTPTLPSPQLPSAATVTSPPESTASVVSSTPSSQAVPQQSASKSITDFFRVKRSREDAEESIASVQETQPPKLPKNAATEPSKPKPKAKRAKPPKAVLSGSLGKIARRSSTKVAANTELFDHGSEEEEVSCDEPDRDVFQAMETVALEVVAPKDDIVLGSGAEESDVIQPQFAPPTDVSPAVRNPRRKAELPASQCRLTQFVSKACIEFQSQYTHEVRSTVVFDKQAGEYLSADVTHYVHRTTGEDITEDEYRQRLAEIASSSPPAGANLSEDRPGADPNKQSSPTVVKHTAKPLPKQRTDGVRAANSLDSFFHKK